jgi:hypothetical protein
MATPTVPVTPASGVTVRVQVVLSLLVRLLRVPFVTVTSLFAKLSGSMAPLKVAVNVRGPVLVRVLDVGLKLVRLKTLVSLFTVPVAAVPTLLATSVRVRLSVKVPLGRDDTSIPTKLWLALVTVPLPVSGVPPPLLLRV